MWVEVPTQETESNTITLRGPQEKLGQALTQVWLSHFFTHSLIHSYSFTHSPILMHSFTHTHSPILIHSFTHTHSLIHAHSPILTCSFTHSPILIHPYSFTHTNTLIHPYSLAHSLIHPYSFTHTNTLIHPYSLAHSLIHPYLLIHSLLPPPHHNQVYEKANSVVTEEVHAPRWLHRFIIGRKGQNVQMITKDLPKVLVHLCRAFCFAAQLIQHLPRTLEVAGSNPTQASSFFLW